MWFQPGGLAKRLPKNPWKELLLSNDEWGRQIAEFVLLAIYSLCQDGQKKVKKKKESQRQGGRASW